MTPENQALLDALREIIHEAVRPLSDLGVFVTDLHEMKKTLSNQDQVIVSLQQELAAMRQRMERIETMLNTHY